MESRREKIEAMLLESPDDVFLRYSLAMEMSKAGEVEPALNQLKALTLESPPYIAAFFRSAQILADEDRVNEARQFLRDGIEAARATGDLHAAGEMSQMLSDIGQLGE